jgi:hypothetical protein
METGSAAVALGVTVPLLPKEVEEDLEIASLRPSDPGGTVRLELGRIEPAQSRLYI